MSVTDSAVAGCAVFQRFFNIAKCHLAQREHWHVMEIWQHNGWDFFCSYAPFKLQREYLNTFSYDAYVLWFFFRLPLCKLWVLWLFLPCWAVELSMAWGLLCIGEKIEKNKKRNEWLRREKFGKFHLTEYQTKEMRCIVLSCRRCRRF